MTGSGKLKKALKTLWRFYVPALIYLVLVFLLFRYANQAAAQNTQLSLRYTDAPINSTTAGQVHDKLADPGYLAAFSTTFWRQLTDMPMETERGRATTGAVYADGEMQGVYPAEFLYGAYPSPRDNGGVAVSEGLAWQLWGGGDLVGTEFEWEGGHYVIRGVFKGVENMILFQENSAYLTDTAYTGVELYGVPEGDPRTAAAEFATELGLGAPNAIISGPSLSGLLLFMAMLPALVLIVWFLARVMGQVHRLRFWPRQVVWFVFLLGLALAVPRLLDMLPAWVIPNKWSDLDSWSDFFATVNTRVNEWLALYPSFRDVDLKRQLLRQALLLVPCLFATTVTIRVWNTRFAALAASDKAAAAEPSPGEEEPTGAEDEAEETERLAELLR